jgi:hypothetical protein
MDGNWTFFDYDPETRTKVHFRLRDDGRTEFHVEQNVDLILQANVEAEKLTHGTRLPDWNRVASIPLRMIEKTSLDVAIQMGDDRYVSRVLNDSDNSKLRTSRGKV